MSDVAGRTCVVAIILAAALPCGGEETSLATNSRDPFQAPAYDVLRARPRAVSRPNAARHDHPLLPVLRYAYASYRRMDADVRDYRCTLVKRERVDGRLRSHEMLAVKLRHQWLEREGVASPFSIYLKFLAPATVKDREILYVAGKYNGDLLATRGGRGALRGVTVFVDPDGPRAMDGSRYPITELGILNLTRRLIEDGMKYMRADTRHECRVLDLPGAKINGRSCRYIEVKFPVRREELRFHLAQIFIDDELQMPVRYAAYSWPREKNQSPPLLEEYTYLNLKFNVSLTDIDFDRANPKYGFFVPEGE